MTHEEKIQYMRMSCSLCDFSLKDEHMDLLVSMYELVMEKKGEADVRSMVSVKIAAEKRANQREIDKVMQAEEQKKAAYGG